ncbi:MAG: DUF1616 domain-containing protein [Dehalococcoidia bacterium]|nr:DUF1616 domain-containing protein [Dehalococcoidia bacterium]
MGLLLPLTGIMDFALPVFGFLPGLRATLGVILVFFLPGFCWTLVFFRGRQVTVVERIALSFGISIAMVTLSIFAVNRVAGVAINGVSSLVVIIVLIIVPVVYYCVRKFVLRNYN